MSPFDQELSVTSSGGNGAGSRLVVPNFTAAWTGDYSAAGITGVTADLTNNSGLTLDLRIGVSGPSGNRWVTSAHTLNTSDTGNYFFSLDPSNFVSAGGSDLAAALANVEEIRLLHNSTVDWKGARVQASFLADNITLVPEPSSLMLFSFSMPLFLRRRR